MFSSSLPGASVTFLSSSPTSSFRGAQSSRSPTSLHHDPTPACSVCSHCWTLFNSYCLEDREFLKVALLIKWLLLKSLLSIVCLLICVNSCLDQWTWDAVLIIHFFFTEWKLIIVHGILNTYGNSAGWTGPPARISETQIPR